VARSVDECDCATHAFVHAMHLVSTDVLRDAARFASNNFGLANSVKHASLTVIDVSHDGNNWWTCH